MHAISSPDRDSVTILVWMKVIVMGHGGQSVAKEPFQLGSYLMASSRVILNFSTRLRSVARVMPSSFAACT